MKMTHGEIRGTIVLGLLLALTLVVLACVRGCRGTDDAGMEAVPEYDMPGRMQQLKQAATATADSTSASAVTHADSTSASGKSRRTRQPKRQRKASVPPPPDRPSPLDFPK